MYFYRRIRIHENGAQLALWGQLTLESSKLISTAERSLRIRGQGSQGGGGTLNKSVKYSNKAN